MYEVIKDMGAVVIIAVNCLCSVFVVKCMKEITKATIDKINYFAELAVKEEEKGLVYDSFSSICSVYEKRTGEPV